MKKLLLLLSVALVASQCKKEKYCYVCSTFNERTYQDGFIQRDTIKMYPCQNEDFIRAYIKNGMYDGPHYEIKSGDTIHFHLRATTVCNRK